MNPTYAATQFYRHLLAIPGWQQLSVNDAAQAVQRSGFPNAYGPHESAAREIIAAVTGSTCVPGPNATLAALGTGDCNQVQAPNPAARTAITYACQQRGVP